jgi:putative aldouronate transport system permease protein
LVAAASPERPGIQNGISGRSAFFIICVNGVSMALHTPNRRIRGKSALVNQRQLAVMSVPIILYIILFAYVPLWGWTYAFQNFKPQKSFFDQQWVGFQWFQMLFSDEAFLRTLRNTLAMSFINLFLGYFSAILLALMLNEVKNLLFKRVVQTISYLPHFLSWIIVTGIVAQSLSTDGGVINEVLMSLNIIQQPVMWLSMPDKFWGIVGISSVWKEVGWNTILYLAAIAAIDPNLYEAAEIDGCNRFQKMWNVTLPGMKSTIIVLLIMSIGHIMDTNFEIPYLLGNGMVLDYSQTIDIFVLTYGINMGNYSLATAAGMFKSVVSIILLLLANEIAKRAGEERLI